MEPFEKYSIPGLPLIEIMRAAPPNPEASPGYVVHYEGKSVSASFATAMEAREFIFLEVKKRLSERRKKFEAVIQKLDAALQLMNGEDVWVLGRYQTF